METEANAAEVCACRDSGLNLLALPSHEKGRGGWGPQRPKEAKERYAQEHRQRAAERRDVDRRNK